ncbi:hypothetical protein EUBDOL_00908 [Amedibacillus dolichus DSM 3991]|uniref:Uncharacterized protein n=1 Tax=Amedibacillus dolichus DSM 3991 TaxID=428127 RepID=A8RAT5_9FIRM|nr:hypothetical protein EUBDOL_00908 [Amedibacillus dolichus DSM 3991]
MVSTPYVLWSAIIMIISLSFIPLQEMLSRMNEII